MAAQMFIIRTLALLQLILASSALAAKLQQHPTELLGAQQAIRQVRALKCTVEASTVAFN